MKDERAPLEPADEEELRAAAALARALESGADEPDLPHSALETAALLRLSAGGGELDPERSKAIENELLAGLPARSERRRRSLLPEWSRAVPRWLLLALPLGGTAALCLLLLVKNPEPQASFADRSFVEQRASDDSASTTLAPGAAREGATASSPMLGSPEARELAASRSEELAAEGLEPAARAQQLALPEPKGSGADAYAPSVERESVRPGAPADESTRAGGTLGGVGSARREAMSANRDRASLEPSPTDTAAGAAAGKLGSGSAVSRSAASGSATSGRETPGHAGAVGNVAPLAGQPSARAALTGLDREVRAERAQLLARSNDSELSRAHAEVDGAQSRAELQRSRANLVRLLETTGEGLGADDARQVRQDLYCRLAETALRLGEPRAALEWSRRGIDLDGPPSPFLAQLMALEGDALAALGEPASAASSYMRALRVHEALLDESLDGR